MLSLYSIDMAQQYRHGVLIGNWNEDQYGKSVFQQFGQILSRIGLVSS